MDANRQSLLPTFVTEQLERVANRALHNAPLTRLQLHKLEGKSFGIELQRPHFPLLVSVTRKGLLFQSHWEGSADVSIRGPATALLRQLRQDDTTPAALMRAGIEVDGDQLLAQQFVKVMKDLDIDLESILGDLIGDLAAHQVTEIARTGLDWLGRAGKALLQQSRTFLTEERKVLLTPRQHARFRDDVEALREDTDRLEARLRQLQQHVANRQPLNSRSQKDASSQEDVSP
ncbi:MAG TPA: SCP2 sterol-binding domain-containing protein [Dongiaceae bacterium]|nr:SCP2 sterol-binding domain-containing protein [Dongiaceae bacterium]